MEKEQWIEMTQKGLSQKTLEESFWGAAWLWMRLIQEGLFRMSYL